VRIALAQIDTLIGEFDENRERIVSAARAGRAGGADLVVLPELAVTGYPPRDLLLEPAFMTAARRSLDAIASELAEGPAVLLGAPVPSGRTTPGHPGLLNAAVLVRGGRIAAIQGKRLLPAYDVFHEPRWFVPADSSRPFDIAGERVGVLVCEDLWDEGHPCSPARDLRENGATLLVTLAASPFRRGVMDKRRHHARRAGARLLYVNAVGANDELVFDGGSFALDAAGREVARLPRFREAVEIVELPEGPGPAPALAPEPGAEEELYEALVAGIQGFASKNGLARALLGLSGGVDSALVACLARDALGPERVTALALPSRYTDQRSTECARSLATMLGISLVERDVEPLCAAARAALGPLLDESPAGRLADENLQARVRALVLTAHLNRHGGLLLNTSNKTELTVGYGTLYGDLAGTLSVIGDVTKPEVYALARWCARERHPIPAFVLDRAPTAELRAGQVDPFDYDRVAPLVDALLRDGGAEWSGLGAEEREIWRRMLRGAEHKRFQHGVVLKVSEHALGTGRMVPITRAW
jgi:NAD+ synthase (glutamine-hydrolysing)